MVRVRDQFQFDDPVPQHVLLYGLFLEHRAVLQHLGILHAREHVVPKLAMLSVECPHLPHQTDVDQCQRHQFLEGAATCDGCVVKPHSLPQTDGPGDRRDHGRRREIERSRVLASHHGLRLRIKTLTKALRKCRQHALGRVVKKRLKGFGGSIELRCLVELQVFGGDLPVLSDVARCTGGAGLESIDQVLSPKLTQKVELEVNECQTLTLGARNFVDITASRFFIEVRHGSIIFDRNIGSLRSVDATKMIA
ncbi:hypothetical protein D9M68_729540 [compost metagenome]